jgi:hypothetical protein
MLCNIIINKYSLKVVDINSGKTQTLTFGAQSQLRFLLMLLRQWCVINNVIINAKEHEDIVKRELEDEAQKEVKEKLRNLGGK